jgi:hypothetical protein
MSRTTFQISSVLASEYPGKTVEHLSNYAVEGRGLHETQIAGVMVRYRVLRNVVIWCYV